MDLSSISQFSAAAAAAPSESAQAPVSTEQRASTHALIKAVKAINAARLFGPENELTFFRDPTTNHVLTRVINRESHEVVFQIPSEDVLRMAEESTER
jgi:uncharacterized FlaG/YvyC family protein